MRIIPTTQTLDGAKPEYHRVCRIGCWKHLHQGTCSIITSQSESNMAQHMMRKYNSAPGLVTLFRYLHSFSFINISSHHNTSHHITFLYYINIHYISSKVAWFELWKQQRSTLTQRGGGYANEFSPLPDKPPRISRAGDNMNEWKQNDDYHQGLQQLQGKYFEIISPDPDPDKYVCNIRQAIIKRYKYIINTFINCKKILFVTIIYINIIISIAS